MPWTDQEIQKYREIRSMDLGPLYAAAGIDRSHPEERAKYLAEEVLKLTMSDQDALMSIAKDRGKAEALRELEIITRSTFF